MKNISLLLMIVAALLLQPAISYGQKERIGILPGDKGQTYAPERDYLDVDIHSARNGGESALTADQLKLDSVVFIFPFGSPDLKVEKFEYVYDDKGRMTQRLRWYINDDYKGLHQEDKTLYVYGETDDFIDRINFEKSKAGDSLVYYRRYKRQLDAAGNLLQSESYGYNKTTQEWKLRWRHVYTYNEKLQRISGYEEVPSGGQMEVTEKYEYSYDSSGNETQFIMKEYMESDSDWVVTLKGEYEYDNDGNTILSRLAFWSFIYHELRYYSQYEYVYTNGLLTEETYSRYESDKWVAKEKTQYFYNADGLLVKRDKLEFDESTFKWYVRERYSAEFDDEGNWKHWEVASRETPSEKLVPSTKRAYEYDNRFAKENLKLPINNGADNVASHSEFTHKIDTKTKFMWSERNNDWGNPEQIEHYYYSAFIPIATQNLVSGDAGIYPTLFESVIHVKGDRAPHLGKGSMQLGIYDLRGYSVFTKKVFPGAAIDLQFLPPGMYIYHLQQGEVSKVGKLVKE